MRLMSSPTGRQRLMPERIVSVTVSEQRRSKIRNRSEWQPTMRATMAMAIFINEWKVSRLMQICIMILVVLNRHTLAAIDWKFIKPLYLISVPPKYGGISNEPVDRIDNETSMNEPDLIMNLDADPMYEDNTHGGGLKAMDRIFGGNVATQFCFPYQVGLLLQRPRGLYWCGGSLISDEYVLTAAHCLDKAKRALIFLGAHEIKNAKEIGQVRLMVNQSNFIIFPTWNSRRLKDDIAIVRLPVPIEFNERIHPIPLPKRSYEYRNFRDKLAIASGWGRYATGVHAISGVLRFVRLRIVDGETCERNFPLSYRSTNICTSGKHEKSTCNGDSGGPLVLQRKISKERVLVGITSFGSIFGCDRGYPAAFTKVASYLDWISDETGIEPSDWKPDAELFQSHIDKSDSPDYLTDSKEFCADLSDDPDIDDVIDDHDHDHDYDKDNKDESNDNGNGKENQSDNGKDGDNDKTGKEKLLYKHEQRYPDGTLLKTQFYQG